MRKFDVFVNNNFSGDKEKALEFLLYSSGEEKLDNYVSELNSKEALFVAQLMRKEAVKHYGGEAGFAAELDKQEILLSLNLTEDEVRNAKTNPYKAKLLKNSLRMLIMDGGIIALSFVAPIVGISASTLGIVGGVATTLFSSTLAANLINYVKFKKIKRNLEKDAPVLDEGRGRSL